MPRTVLFLVLLLCCALPARAVDFDCHAPPFGVHIDKIAQRADLKKYKDQGAVAYYTFDGPCDYNLAAGSPKIAYAFVDGVLFARIIEIPHADFDEVRKIAPKAYGSTPKETKSGKWTILKWSYPDRGLQFKIKYDNETGACKSALYFEPLRERIREITDQQEIFDALAPPQ